MEDKRKVVRKLEQLLMSTREYYDLTKLSYEVTEDGSEYVFVYFEHSETPCYRVNVTADSGIALVRDVLRRIS